MTIVTILILFALICLATGFFLGIDWGISIGKHLAISAPRSRVWHILWSVVSMLFLVTAIGMGINSIVFKANSIPTTATITDIAITNNDEEFQSAAITYRYTDSAKSELKSRDQAWWNLPEVGEQIQIRYLKSNPEKSRIDSFIRFWTPALALLAASIVFALCALWQWTARRYEKRLIAAHKKNQTT